MVQLDTLVGYDIIENGIKYIKIHAIRRICSRENENGDRMDIYSEISLCVFKGSHAIPQMLARGISTQRIERLLCFPYNIVPHRNTPNRWVYHETNNNFGLKVVVDLNSIGFPPQIVTTFVPQ